MSKPSALTGIENCGLHRRTPYGMTNVSMTQLSIARHYGSCTYNGDFYIYNPATDELIRHDVLKWQRKQKTNDPSSATAARNARAAATIADKLLKPSD